PRESLQQWLVVRTDRADGKRLAFAIDDLGLELDRIGFYGEAGRALLLRWRTHDDPGVEGDHPFLVGQQRVDVELGDLVDVGDELGQADHDVAHRATVGRRPVTEAAQQAVDAGAAQRILGQRRVGARGVAGAR